MDLKYNQLNGIVINNYWVGKRGRGLLEKSIFTYVFSFKNDERTEIKIDYDNNSECFSKNLRIYLPEIKGNFFDLELIRIFTKWGLPVPKLRDTKEIEINLFEEER